MQCSAYFLFYNLDYMNQGGTGYFQQSFTTTCTNETCTFGEINKEKLALGKLARDVAKPTTENPADHLA